MGLIVLKVLGWAVVGVVVIAGAGFLALRRGDIPYPTLEARYATPASRFIDLPGGLHVHYRDEGNPNGPVLLLVHGYSASAADWDAWASRLGDAYRIIAIDLPGHGLTRTPKGYKASTDGFVETVEALATRLALPKFVIAGNSMGGGVAWNYALAHPDRVSGLVLVDSVGWPPRPRRADEDKKGALIFKLLSNPVSRQIIKNLDNRSFAKQGLESAFIDKSLVSPALVDRYTDLSRAPGHRDILLEIEQAPHNVATPERLAAIHVPTLIMFGEQDHLIPAEDGKTFADAIPGSTLILYPGVGHVPMEQIPDKSAADLKAWLASKGLGASTVKPAA
jgi:pimeloyl-ACP methyl ester carboxylesterase